MTTRGRNPEEGQEMQELQQQQTSPALEESSEKGAIVAQPALEATTATTTTTTSDSTGYSPALERIESPSTPHEASSANTKSSPSIQGASLNAAAATSTPSPLTSSTSSTGNAGVSPKGPSRAEQRSRQFEAELERPKIEMKKIRDLAFSGCPEKPGIRAAYWKLLLSYLPTDRSRWEETLARDRAMYRSWVKDLIVDPHAKFEEDTDDVKDVTFEDHPLSTAPDSTWAEHFKDLEIMGEIKKDVRRTFPHLHFFNKDGAGAKDRHYDALLHILFMYAKLNPGVGYVQGMNEVLGPIYYIFASDPNIPSQEAAEADAFNCFKNLMAEIMNNFCKSLDKSEVGITASMKRLNDLLKRKDYELWDNLEKKSMNPQFYSFRWITLLLSQEFELPDTLRLWDSFFSDDRRFEFFFYVCCAMLINVRDRLLEGDFADNLKLLQNFPPTVDVHTLIEQAVALRTAPDDPRALSPEERPILVVERPPPPSDPDLIESFFRRWLG